MKIPIFYYHSIGGAPPETLSLDCFRRHLDHLVARNIRTLTFSDLLNHRYSPGEKCAVLTFDDGLLDNYTVALPELLERGLLATFFVVPNHAGSTRWVDPQSRHWSDTKQPSFTVAHPCMDFAQMREMVAAGMEIGCHSYTHRKLSQIDPRELTREIHDAKAKLEDEIGCAVTSFCYPKGGHNQTVIQQVKAAGFIGASTTWPGYFNPQGDPFRCNRFLVEDPHYFTKVLDQQAFSPTSISYLLWKYFQHRLRGQP